VLATQPQRFRPQECNPSRDPLSCPLQLTTHRIATLRPVVEAGSLDVRALPVCLNRLHALKWTKAHPGGRKVPRKVSRSMSGSMIAYGPPSWSSSNKNCVSGVRSRAPLPHSGVIHHSLQRAAAR